MRINGVDLKMVILRDYVTTRATIGKAFNDIAATAGEPPTRIVQLLHATQTSGVAAIWLVRAFTVSPRGIVNWMIFPAGRGWLAAAWSK